MDKTEMDPRRKRVIFVNIIIACFATTMMSTALSTALPGILVDFDISASTGQWLTSAYSLAMAVMVPVTSFMVKRVPTRRLFILVIGVFTLGLVIDVLAVDFYTLLLGRLLQAGANGVLIAAAQIILLTIYPREVHGKVMGWYGITLTAAPIISPTLAGILIDAFDWRMVFILPLAIMLVSLVCTLLTFEDILDTERLRFDTMSFVLCAFAFGGLTFGVGNVMTEGVVSVLFIVPVLVGAVALALFTRRQLSLEVPFLQI
ncbi:MAG: MFS transporter [archaeon]|nr:MFS transporter [archaeon]